MRESLLFVTDKNGHRTVCLLPILRGNQPKGPGSTHYGLMMERVGEDCAFKLVRLQDVHTAGARSLTDGPVAGCLGIIRRNMEDFCCVITKCTLVADLSQSSSRKIYRIDRVAFYGISNDKYDNYDAYSGYINKASTGVGESGVTSDEELIMNPTADLAAYLSSGYFYFSYDHDLTQSVQREEQERKPSWRTCSATFFWNAFLLDPIREFAEGLGEEHLQFIEHGGLFVVTMQGFIQSISMPYLSPSTTNIRATVVSRLSCHRAGTRFRSRGIDDDGHVANFVETEVILLDESFLFSYLILRGSVPVFWDQQGLQFGRPTFQITRNAAATQPAFDRHFDRMVRQYGLVHCLDLLGQKPNSAEFLLSMAFKLHAERYPGYPDSMSLTQFDVNAVCRGEDLDRVGSIMPWISQDLQIFSYFHLDSVSKSIVKTQKGVFRVNCQDCLDRTNLIQGFIAKTIVELFIRQHVLSATKHLDMISLMSIFSELWANNGDALSMIYTGTGALRSGYTRSGRRTLAGLMDDVRKTAQRFYVNNFQDKTRQQAVDILLGKQSDQERVIVFNPVAKAVLTDLTSRIDEYSLVSSLKILAVTWNCNGAVPRNAYDTNCLLELITCPDSDDPDSIMASPEIIVISFQEIVELSATQIMSADLERRLEWEAFIQEALDSIAEEEYSLLVSNQLVGTSLSIFVRAGCIPHVRQVEISNLKTGLGGMAGNKGSVGIRLEYHDTSLCFLASHFTAGQQYAMERNREYSYISGNMIFSKGRNIDSHDVVIWMGDFNYRVDIPGDVARTLIQDREYDELLKADQLTRSMAHKLAFNGFKEAKVTFPPTYKYDLHSAQYDTSEKMRTPSYCDRVLIKGLVEVTWYGRAAGVDLSDHRPVKALCLAKARKIDREKLEQLQSKLLSKYTEDMAHIPPELPDREPSTNLDGDAPVLPLRPNNYSSLASNASPESGEYCNKSNMDDNNVDEIEFPSILDKMSNLELSPDTLQISPGTVHSKLSRAAPKKPPKPM